MTKKEERIKLQDDIANYVSRGASTSLLGLDGVGSYMFLYSVIDSASTKYGAESVHVNCSDLVERSPVYFYRSLLLQFVEFLRERGLTNHELDDLSSGLLETDLFILVGHLQRAILKSLEITDKKPIIIIVSKLSKMTDLDKSFYSGLRSLRNQDKDRISFLFRDSYHFIHAFTSENSGELYEIIRSNVAWIPLSVGDPFINIVENNEKKFNCNLNKKEREQVLRITNGHAGLIKYSVMYFGSHGEIDDESIASSDAIKVRILRMIDELDDDEKDLIYRIADGEKVNSSALDETFLVDSQLLRDNEGVLEINIPLVEIYLRKLNGRKKARKPRVTKKTSETNGIGIDIEEDDVYIDGERMDVELTRTEFNVLKYLVDNKGSVVSRDDIAEVIWGSMQDEKFSDWAIDQTISRLRKKIGDSGYNSKMIKTIRGRGFKLVT